MTDTPSDLATVIEGVLVDPRDGADDFQDINSLTDAWLASYGASAHTRDAYERDINHFLGWCEHQGRDPLVLRRPHIDVYAAYIQNSPTPHTGRPLSPSSVGRRLAAMSSWYGYMADAGLIAANPMARVRRPKVDKDASPTIGMTAVEATNLRAAAATGGYLPAATSIALAGFLVEIGARVSEVCGLDVSDLGHDSGHRTVRLRMKGGKFRTRAVPPDLNHALDELLAGRTEGPVFLGPTGQRIDRFEVATFVRRAAKAAGLESWARITPHSFRHAWATIAREKGATLEERQYALGHADPRTTQRYDRARESLDRDPSYLVAGATTVGS